jgi:hypothetical protein
LGRSRIDPYSPHRGNFCRAEGGEKKLFLIIVNVLGHPKGVEGLTSYFFRGVVWMFSGMTHSTVLLNLVSGDIF